MDFQRFKEKFEKAPVVCYANEVQSNPVVSVCVITYQHINSIRKCLDAILTQETDFPFEILLGEDNSTDGTRNICIEYAEKYSEKIRLFLHKRENNIRIGNTPTGRFNLMYNIFSARGKYLAFCEGDDYWTDPKKLQKQVDFLETHSEFNVCSTCYTKWDSQNRTELIMPQKLLKSEFNFIETNRFRPYHTCTILVRNNFTLPAWFSEVYPGDQFFVALAMQDKLLKLLPDITAVYNREATGLVKSVSTSKLDRKKQINAAKLQGFKYLNEYTGYQYDEYFKYRIREGEWAIERKLANQSVLKEFMIQKQIFTSIIKYKKIPRGLAKHSKLGKIYRKMKAFVNSLL